MGCTSSAPNVIEGHPNSTDRTIHFIDEKHDEIGGNGATKKTEKEMKHQNFLHPSDNVDRNIFVPNSSSNAENIHDNQGKPEDISDPTVSQRWNHVNMLAQEKITTLKEVVEHVMSNKDLEKQENVGNISSEFDVSHVVEHETESHFEPIKEENVPSIITPQEEFKEEVQESASPSQSDSSRATRWEALADMAAELPPSLTVDPITGHIYTLSK